MVKIPGYPCFKKNWISQLQKNILFLQKINAMKYYFVIILLSIFINSYSQDTINLLNGNQIIAKSIFYEPASSMLKYDVIKKNKVKQKIIDRIDIYSIRFSDNTEKIFYYPDSIIGYTLSQSDMYDFILGEREAIKNYKNPNITIGGFFTGGIAVSFMRFWGVISPVVYATPIATINTKIKLSDQTNPSYLNNQNFVNGYKNVVTKKRLKNALFGSIAGVTTFAIISAIINKN